MVNHLVNVDIVGNYKNKDKLLILVIVLLVLLRYMEICEVWF